MVFFMLRLFIGRAKMKHKQRKKIVQGFTLKVDVKGERAVDPHTRSRRQHGVKEGIQSIFTIKEIFPIRSIKEQKHVTMKNK